MNILAICHYGMYQDMQTSFVHAQTSAYAALGHRVRVIVPIAWGKRSFDGKRFSPTLQKAESDGVEVYALRHLSLSHYGQKRFNTITALAALKGQLNKILTDFQPDVIHAHTLGFDSEVGAWLKERLGVPLVVTTHGSDTSIPVEAGELSFLRDCCESADHIVAVSSFLGRKLSACGTQTPITTVLNGFRAENVREFIQKIPASLVQVCNLLRQKGTHLTLEAFAHIQQAHPDATLTVIGQGPERETLETQAASLGVSEAVHFLGQLPNHQAMAQMAKSQFFVMPSVREGFGIAYVEAMASGCITIGTEGEGISDLICHGENGFLVPPEDVGAIARIIEFCLSHPQTAQNIAERGRRDALQLTWQANAESYLALFRRLTEKEV